MFFEQQNIPAYIDGMSHKNLKIGKEKYKGTSLTLKVDPLTPELAAELEAVKGIVFRRNDAEPNPHIDAVNFTLKPKPQTIEIRPDPQLSKASVKILEAKIQKIRCRKSADSPTWALIFQVVFAEVSGNDLLYLKDALFEQRFFTFMDAQGGLFEEAEAEARRESAAAKPVRPTPAQESAVAH